MDPIAQPDRSLLVAHLTASPFFGGPERQMLGLGLQLPPRIRSVFLCFTERGLAQPFTNELRRHDLSVVELSHNAPHLMTAAREVAEKLEHMGADVLCCHGYKPDIIGYMAARRLDVPVAAISRGWTAATAKVRLNETLDRRVLRWMDHVVCVSAGQAAKVAATGVAEDRITVIRNAIDAERFDQTDPAARSELLAMFPRPVRRVAIGAGRLSPEKGFGQLVASAAILARRDPDIGVVIFGDGPLRADIEAQVRSLHLTGHVLLPGFRDDLDRFIAAADVVVLPSFTEGLPNVALEAAAAGVPVVATAVGGTGEVVEDGATGYLVAAGDPEATANRICDLLWDDRLRRSMGDRARRRIREHFTFAAQAEQYVALFDRLAATPLHLPATLEAI